MKLNKYNLQLLDTATYFPESIYPTLLLRSIYRNNSKLSKQLIKYEIGIYEWNGPHNLSPLILASKQGNTEIIRLLLEKYKERNNEIDKIDKSIALINSIKYRKNDITQLLLEDNNLEINYEFKNRSSLYCAVFNDDLDLVNSLITYGADINKYYELDGWKINILFLAVNKNNKNLTQKLLEYGCEPYIYINDKREFIDKVFCQQTTTDEIKNLIYKWSKPLLENKSSKNELL